MTPEASNKSKSCIFVSDVAPEEELEAALTAILPPPFLFSRVLKAVFNFFGLFPP